MKNIFNNLYCDNCNNKITNKDLSCSYCGKTRTNDIVTEESSIVSKQDDKNINTNSDKQNKKDGLICSIISAILFILFYCPFLYIIILAFIDAFKEKTIHIWIIILGAMAAKIIIPTIASFVLGIISIKRYNNCRKAKNLFRKILNIINIISTIIMTGFIIILIFMFLLFLLLLLVGH